MLKLCSYLDGGALVLQRQNLGPVDRRDGDIAAHQGSGDFARPRGLGEGLQFLDLGKRGVDVGIALAEQLARQSQEELRPGIADLVQSDPAGEFGILPQVGPGFRWRFHHVGAPGEPDGRNDAAQSVVAGVEQAFVQVCRVRDLRQVQRLEEAFGAQGGGNVFIAHENGIGRSSAAGADLRHEILAKTHVDLAFDAGGGGEFGDEGRLRMDPVCKRKKGGGCADTRHKLASCDHVGSSPVGPSARRISV